MSNWTPRIPIAFPEALLADANRLAAIIDPDVGGALTFNLDQTRAGYVYAEIPLMTHFEPIVRERDPDMWQHVINALADNKGLERLAPDTIEVLRGSMLFGADECAALGEGDE